MQTVEVGIHIHLKEGISFVGIEEVNRLIQQGGRVVAVEPGDAIMEKLGEEGGKVQLTLTGCTIKIQVEEAAGTAAASPASDRSRHNRLYGVASALIKDLILYHGQEPAELDEGGRRRLEEAIRLFTEVLQINPGNWPAMWQLGKTYQRLGDFERGLEWFARAHILQPDQPDVAREAALAAMDVGRPAEAIPFCERAIEAKPDDPGLRANLALALLFSGKPSEAREVAGDALERDPSDEITANLVGIIDAVLAGVRSCPRHIRELQS